MYPTIFEFLLGEVLAEQLMRIINPGYTRKTIFDYFMAYDNRFV